MNNFWRAMVVMVIAGGMFAAGNPRGAELVAQDVEYAACKLTHACGY